MFSSKNIDTFKNAYPYKPAMLLHDLADHPLFQLDKLVELSQALPTNRVEYNPGDVPVDLHPDNIPTNGLSIQETIRSIELNNSWLVLKNVEMDPTYAALMNSCLESLQFAIEPVTGTQYKKEAFIFVSSPNSITPFHMDPEHNILMQVRGSKEMAVYPANHPDILTQEQHEAFHAGGHRNLAHTPEFDSLATKYALSPGDALHVPVKAPHWVKNGNAVSISLSITWRSHLSDKEGALHLMNGYLRKKGLTPSAVGKSTWRDSLKAFSYKGLRRTF